MIRDEIIKYLDKPVKSFDNYQNLKYCLNFNQELSHEKVTELSEGIDNWFKGVIDSLYYKPNKYVLVLEGKQGIGKSWFFRYLFPKEIKPYQFALPKEGCLSGLIYSDIILDYEFTKKTLSISNEHNFKVTVFPREDGLILPTSYKRLASYCSTTNKWQFPQRKNIIVLKLESINLDLYNSIDKELLWIEIFNMFKPK